MPFGLIVAIVVLVGFAVWGLVLLRSKIVEKPSEASSHYESRKGITGSHGGGY